MKGLVLAAGKGSRLWPITRGLSKQLLPIYDKPLIHYPIATLMLANIREILVIVSPADLSQFERALGDGSSLGIEIRFAVQDEPRGLAEAFIIGEKFIQNSPSALILGDNIFHGTGLGRDLRKYTNPKGANIFGYEVVDPQSYGVIQVSENGEIVSIEEKPNNPKSNLAIPGVYFFDSTVVNKAKRVKKSARGEYEITDVNKVYLEKKKLQVAVLDNGTAWLDTGTHDSLLDAAGFIATLQKRQGLMVACPEEIAYRNQWISANDVEKIASQLSKNSYGQYLKKILTESH